MKKRSERTKVAAAAKTIGLDLGDQRSQVCVLDQAGEVLSEFTVPTTPSSIEREFGRFAPSCVVLETGTSANWVHDLLTALGHEAVVANARKVRAISANERKSDVRDARMLARLGRVDVKLLEPVVVRPADVRLGLTLVRARAAAVESRTQLINAVRGLAKAAGHRFSSCSTSCFHKQALPAALESALRGLLASIEQLSKTIDDYDEKIETLAREKYPQTKLLTQISGVGALTALTFVLTLGDTARFKSGRDAGAFFGLVPGRDQSGGRDPQMRITKCGDAMVRTLLVQCAHRVLSTRAPDTDLRRFGEKLATRGGKAAKKRAVVATARKLAVLMFALLRNGEAYEPLRNSAAPVTP
jgi:transposase